MSSQRPDVHEQAQIEHDRRIAVFDLTDWWRSQSEAEIEAVVPKAVEYSSVDLAMLGEWLMAFNPGLWAGAGAEERRAIAAEMGTAFYIMGKVARMVGAYSEGRIPSDDTLHDIAVYTKMAQRIRHTGQWGV